MICVTWLLLIDAIYSGGLCALWVLNVIGVYVTGCTGTLDELVGSPTKLVIYPALAIGY